MTISPNDSCNAPLPPQAVEGLRLFNAGHYFEAHEALEDAWNAERGKVRELYRGILQIAVVYLHITRRNYDGALKVYGRSQRWMKDWPAVCRGIQVEELRRKPISWIEKHTYICDRCGYEMYEKNCKVTCPNCGNRFDCSDLNIYFD
jgi:predicted metal-dependent hydrolase